MKPKSVFSLLCSGQSAYIFAGAIAALLATPAARADNGTWTGGSGSWDTPANWASATANGAGSTANFNTLNLTADLTVTVGSNRIIGNLVFGDTAISTAGGWLLGGAATLTLEAATPTITVRPLGTGKIATISTVLNGSDGLTKNGAGTLALTGASLYTGTTTVSAGTLQIGDGATGSLNGTTGTALTFGGSGTFHVKEAAGSAQGMGLLTIGSGDGTVQSTFAATTATLTFNSLAGRTAGTTGNFVVSGGLNGANHAIVFTTPPATAQLIDRGLFFNGSAYAAYDASGAGHVRDYKAGDANFLSVAGGATMGTPATRDNVVLTGNITAQTTADGTVNTLNLAANSVSMASTADVLSVDGLLSSGATAATLGSTGGILQPATAGGELVVRVNGTTDKLTTKLTIQNNTSASILTKTGAGTLVLEDTTANNTYSGGTFINAGTVQLGALNSGANGARAWFGPAAATVTLADGAAITSVNDPAKTVANVIQLSGGFAGFSSRDINVSGKVSGPGGMIVNAAGRWLHLSNSGNDFSGGLIFRGAAGNTLQFTHPSAMGTGPIRTEANANLQPLASMSTGTGVSNPIDLAPATTLTVTTASATPLLLSGGTSGAGTLSKNGPGSVTLSGTSTHTGGTTISDGLLTVSGSGTFGSNGGNLTVSGGILDLAGGTWNAGTVTISGGTIQNGTLSGKSYAGQKGFVSANLTGGSIALTMNSANSRLVLSGTNTYGGATNITNGTLQPTTAAALPNYASGTISVAANGTLLINSSNWTLAQINDLLANPLLSVASGGTVAIDTVGGNFSTSVIAPAAATLGIRKLGANTMTITGASTYTGRTTVNAGTLTIDAAAGGSLSASSALTFSGTGTFNYNTTATSQRLGALTFATGDGTVRLTRTTDQALTFSSMAARGAGATANFSLSGGTPSATNGFVLSGVTANTFIDQGTFFGGGAYAWYDNAGFVRAIDYVGPDTGAVTSGTVATLASATHQQITGAITAQDSATFTTLNIAGDHNFTLNGGATVTVNGILKSGNNGSPAVISGGTGINTVNNGELIVRTDGPNDSLTIGTPVLANGTSFLTKTGAGTLTLNAANTITGGVVLNAGQLNINNAAALGTLASRLTINEGTVLDNTTSPAADISILTKNPVTINGSFTYKGTSGDLSFPNDAGQSMVMPNDVTITVLANTLKIPKGFGDTPGGGSFAKLTKDGPGTLWIGTNGNSNYSGGLVVNAGVVTGNLGQAEQFAGRGPIALGASSGSSNAVISSGGNTSHSGGITVRSGSNVILAMASYGGLGTWGGPVELGNNLTLSGNGGSIDLSGRISGGGDIVIGNTGSYKISSGVSKSFVNTGTIGLYGINTSTGRVLLNSGTLRLGPNASPGGSPLVSLAAGTTLDVTLIPAFTLGSGSTLEAKGTGTGTGTTAARIQGASGGTVNLGERPVNLTFTPTVFTGDTARPALLVSEGTLVLNNNTFTVNNAAATALGVGVYRLIEVTRNTVTQNASPFYPVSVTGSGLESGTAATISVSSGQVILTVDVADTTYASWAADKGLDGTAGKENGIGDDPDGDGATNLIEFALNGNPLDGSDNGYQEYAIEDTDADTRKELTLTLAVRNGTGSPVFSVSSSPSVTVDGVTYTIEGSVDLNFPGSGVSETSAPTGLDPLPSGWEYRRFRLDVSNGLPDKGFLRVEVTK